MCKQNDYQSFQLRPTSMWRVFEALPAPRNIERTQLVKAEHLNSSAMTERLRKRNRLNTATPMNEHQVTNPFHLDMDIVVFVDTGQSRLVRVSCHRNQLKRTIVVRSNNQNKNRPLPLLPTADQHAGDKTHQQRCTILLVSLAGSVRCYLCWICWISAGNRYWRIWYFVNCGVGEKTEHPRSAVRIIASCALLAAKHPLSDDTYELLLRFKHLGRTLPLQIQDMTGTFRRSANLAVLGVLKDCEPDATSHHYGSRVGVCCDVVRRQFNRDAARYPRCRWSHGPEASAVTRSTIRSRAKVNIKSLFTSRSLVLR